MKKKVCILMMFVLIISGESIAEKPYKGGKWGLHITINEINNFLTKPDKEPPKNSTGFLGLAVGLDYYYSESSFITLGISGAMDFFLPIPVAIDLHPGAQYENISSVHISLSNNHKIGDFAIGYGLSYAVNSWNAGCVESESDTDNKRCDDSIYKGHISKSHSAFGLIFPTSYRIVDNIGIGIIYRPTFYRPNVTTDKLAYEHLISLLLIGQIF